MKLKFRILYYKQFLGKKCGIQENCRLADDGVVEYVGVVCALLDLYTIVFGKQHILQVVGVMCALLILYTILFEVKNIFCGMLGLCTVGFMYHSF
jgi:galactokinase